MFRFLPEQAVLILLTRALHARRTCPIYVHDA
jgi:hypothetical protein